MNTGRSVSPLYISRSLAAPFEGWVLVFGPRRPKLLNDFLASLQDLFLIGGEAEETRDVLNHLKALRCALQRGFTRETGGIHIGALLDQ